ncbi:MAG: SsrA-binding protein [Candidatus Colwellbacteria bacterium RIFCSPLOWO2_01_FULL_48_10]|uniref:SsrA-binding protein n=2 Tax=Bacteria candidate phyla TaxID=1783234 RepID=A0A1F5NZ24_9BACT|nr:MAG: SsrA-binding protein [Candidatus Doudnabacteria bacterium RIFCSPHIGHO2_01_FULL_49_9]OGY59716.1 MAG: SsrA-binding protein [Candidatus Colwellbacteria bacterium RIFCSPLOWO2_01_FULL_48_10]
MPELAFNKRVHFDYEILEKFEAGIELQGFEVKAIRAGRLNLGGSYAVIRPYSAKATKGTGNEAWLINADLPPYQAMNTPEGYDSKRNRRLLLKKDEIREIIGRIKESKLTIVPISAYTKGALIKLSIGLARPKKKADKRESIKKRETEREMRRFIK